MTEQAITEPVFDRDNLAARFAAHLSRHRRDALGMTGAWIITPERPHPCPGFLLLPHLLAVRDHSMVGGVADAVVWELLREGLAAGWLGRALPACEFRELVAANLPRLLDLRRQARFGALPTTAAGRDLRTILDGGRYLSIRLVYQHDDLFRRLLLEAAT